MSEKPLEGHVAIVTGGARRIGRTISLTLAAAGANVVVHYLTSAAGVKSLVSDIQSQGGRAVAVEANLAEPATGKKLVEAAQQAFGRLDILINNAGIFERGTVEETTPELWDRFMAVNLRAPFFTAQAAAPVMRAQKRGKIVNIASLGGLLAWPGYIPYAVSKAGVIHLTRCLARALGPEIQVNCVCPGSIQFPGDAPDENYIRKAALGRTGEANDIAQAVLFLLTQEFITGQALVVDGGYALA